MASRIKSVFSAKWPEIGSDCYVEPIVLFETKRLFRQSEQHSTHGLHVGEKLDWLDIEHFEKEGGKIYGVALICQPKGNVRRASFALRVQRLEVPKAKVRTSLTVNQQQHDLDVTFVRNGQTLVVAEYENDSFIVRPPAILNSMASVLAFGRWHQIPG